MPEARSILLVGDARSLRGRVFEALEAVGCSLLAVRGGDAALETLRRHRVELVVADLRAPGTDGLALLRRIRAGEALDPRLPVILVAEAAPLEAALRAGRLGASDFLPLHDEGVARLCERSAELLAEARPELPDALVGASRTVRSLRRRIRALAGLELPVLLCGAPNAGHEAVASQLHARSPRAGEPLLRHEAGRGPSGLALDARGTLHVLGAERLSGAEQDALRSELRRSPDGPGPERARLVVSAPEEPDDAVEAGRLDAELLARLRRFRIRLPRLRERRGDLPELVERLLGRSSSRLGRSVPHLHEEALGRLARHPWPNDLDDLARAAELLVALAPDGRVTPAEAEAALAELEAPLDRIARNRQRDERRRLLALYEQHGTYTGVAHELGLTRNAAKHRLAKHGLIPRP